MTNGDTFSNNVEDSPQLPLSEFLLCRVLGTSSAKNYVRPFQVSESCRVVFLRFPNCIILSSQEHSVVGFLT
jgi:hypothetical protein